MSDGIRGIDAVIDHGAPGRIALHRLVLAEGDQQVGKGLLGNSLGDNRFAQRHENRMRWMPVIASAQLAFPPIEQFPGAGGFRDFIA